MLSYFLYSLFIFTIYLGAAQEDSRVIDLTDRLKYNQLVEGIETSDVDRVMENMDLFTSISHNPYFYKQKTSLLVSADFRYQVHRELLEKIKKESLIKDRVYSVLTLYSIIDFFSIVLSDDDSEEGQMYRSRNLFSSWSFALMCACNMYAIQNAIVAAQRKCNNAALIKDILHANDFHSN